MKITVTSLLNLLLLLLAFSVQAKGVAAGVVISNTVVVTADGIPEHGLRATTEFTVAEVLNMDLVSLDSQAVPTVTPANDRILSFQLTNTGNGTESFLLTSHANITSDNFDPVVNSIWVETNNISGLQNNSTNNADSQYLVNINEITLAADESVIIYVLSSIPESLGRSETGKIVLIATSDTTDISQYTIGQSIAAAGDNGVDLVLLKDQGKTAVTGTYITTSLRLNMSKKIVKIVGPYNKERVMPGTAVTYEISVSATGSGVIKNLVVTDPTPLHMHYKTGSLKLNNISLSDLKDRDQGDFGSSNKNSATLVLGQMKPSNHFAILITYIID